MSEARRFYPGGPGEFPGVGDPGPVNLAVSGPRGAGLRAAGAALPGNNAFSRGDAPPAGREALRPLEHDSQVGTCNSFSLRKKKESKNQSSELQ